MGKNISISEGDYGRKFSPSKLKTNLQSGGSCLWVPKDNTKLVTKRINKAGFYEAKWDEAYGYSKVTVTGIASDDDLKVIEKTVTENGSYSARNDNAAGYNIAKVKVKGGGTYTDETGKKVTPDPSTSPGSAVVGVNPDTGNEEVEKIDDDGNLKTLELASYIQLDTPPTKMSYQDGERIMMSGAVAHGYKKDGTPYKGTLAASELPWHQYGDSESSEYSEDFLPGGIVFEMPLYADISKTGGGDSEASSDLNCAPFTGAFAFGEETSVKAFINTYRVSDNTAPVFLTTAKHIGTQTVSFCYVFASSEPFKYYVNASTRGNDATSVTINGKKCYVFSDRTAAAIDYATVEPVYNDVSQEITSANFRGSNIGWTMIYGEIKLGGTQEITLTWPREGDRKHLQTTFDITVTE